MQWDIYHRWPTETFSADLHLTQFQNSIFPPKKTRAHVYKFNLFRQPAISHLHLEINRIEPIYSLPSSCSLQCHALDLKSIAIASTTWSMHTIIYTRENNDIKFASTLKYSQYPQHSFEFEAAAENKLGRCQWSTISGWNPVGLAVKRNEKSRQHPKVFPGSPPP